MNTTAHSLQAMATRKIAALEWLVLWSAVFLPPLALLIVEHGTEMLVRFYPDDAFYYLQIAWNAVRNGSVSFDGSNITSGFHPLQLLLCMTTFLFADKSSALIALFIFNALAIAVSLTLLVNRLSARPIAIAAALLLTLPIATLYIWTSSGLESALLLICCSLFASAWLRSGELDHRSIGRGFILGLGAGLVILSRLDTVVPLSIFGAVFLLQAIRSKIYAVLAATFSGALILIAPYLLWMLKVQGSILPVSGVAKHARPRWPFTDVWRALTGDTLVGSALLLFPALICLLTVGLSARKQDLFARFIFLTSLSGLLHIFYLLCIAHEPFRWYLAYPLYTAMAGTIWLLSNCEKKFAAQVAPPRLLLLGILVASINYATLLAFSKIPTTSHGLWTMTQRLTRLLPGDARLATFDAGVVGYFSGFTVVNLDGLVNSLANWRDYLAPQKYSAYLAEEQIQFLLIRGSIGDTDSLHTVPTIAFDAEHDSYRLNAGAFGDESLYKIDRAILKDRYPLTQP